ncbi:heterokaryon incompatibility protein-domain-containing protein [Leptodontidium sp. MPI-SDFR-AT-0119]|nr:heterokaryon incompatibility protein-domain-containing protein [Leptodontidium sp. MPI-SDFR-AT-0119]
MICPECHDLNLQGREEGFIVRVSKFQPGCKFCALLLSLVEHFAPLVTHGDLEPKLRIDQMMQDCAAVNIEIMVNDLAQGLGSVVTAASVWLYRTTDSLILELPSLGRLGTLSSHSGSDECFQFTKSQIQTCLSSHPKCNQTTSLQVPKRMIDIGYSSTDLIKLVELPPNTNAKYIALSHCWGTHQPINTTLANLSQMENNIPWTALSAVFQDAITVSRKLGLSWIWIDSLCIIQDSKSDWEIESSKMGTYYSNAHLTISASSSSNGTIPFLAPRSPAYLPKTFPFPNNDGTIINLTARKHTGSSMSQLLEPLAPLASRGWVWQENILSTRILHYTASELIFECKTHFISEDGAKPRGFYSMGLSQKLSQNETEPERCWNALMESYSVRKLTFEGDRLPAISGVASVLESRMGGSYLAGLWRGNLVMGLCWSRDYVSENEELPLFLPRDYVAPSWSWASVNGAIEFVDRNEDPNEAFVEEVVVVDVDCEVKGLNRFGEVSSGFLILRGDVVRMRLNCSDARNCWTFTVGEDPETSEPMAPDCALVRYVDENGSEGVRRAKLGEVLASFEVDVWCMKLGMEGQSDEAFVYGIVVAKSEDSETYIRLGSVQLGCEWFQDAIQMEIRVV